MRRKPLRLLVVLLFGIGAGTTATGCEGAAREGPGHRPQALALSPRQERDLGDQAFHEVLKEYQGKVQRDGKLVDRVRTVGNRIVEAVGIEPLQREINLRVKGYTFDWQYVVLESDQVNAFCLPSGKVAVFTGMFDVVQNDDQLATVLSHEIAHALAHHASERIARAQKYQHAMDALNGALGRMDPAVRKELIGLLAAGAQTRSLAYDRQQESEADHIGLFLMTFAQYDPNQALVFWQRMAEHSAHHGRPPEILSDHPSDAHRIAQMRKWIPTAINAHAAYKAGRIAR
jgi:predicted Zn-dependent protease